MSDNPFATVSGTARDREEALFEFLAAQARVPQASAWKRFASEARNSEDAGFCALILSNLLVNTAAEVAGVLYGVASDLLGDRLSSVNFEFWLEKGIVDVPRLAAHLDHALSVES